ncbi:hypothetical protein DINM_006132 [Dirofilaria immitis]|nr:hypothetical protein [Dirofilaria immitis]
MSSKKCSILHVLTNAAISNSRITVPGSSLYAVEESPERQSRFKRHATKSFESTYWIVFAHTPVFVPKYMYSTLIFMVFNLCLLTYTFPSNLWVKNIIQASNEDGPGYVTKVAISESEQLIILEKLSHFWDNITQPTKFKYNAVDQYCRVFIGRELTLRDQMSPVLGIDDNNNVDDDHSWFISSQKWGVVNSITGNISDMEETLHFANQRSRQVRGYHS